MDKKSKEDLVVSGHRAFASWNPIFNLESPLRVRMKAVEELTFSVTMNDFPEQQKLGEALDGLVRKCEGFRNLNYCCASEQASSSGVSSLPVTPPLNTINKSSDGSDENIDRANQDTNAVKNDSDGENSCSGEYPMRMIHGGVEMVIIGNNDTRIPAKLFDTILWNSAASAARQLLGFIFSDDELATHTLTGKIIEFLIAIKVLIYLYI